MSRHRTILPLAILIAATTRAVWAEEPMLPMPLFQKVAAMAPAAVPWPARWAAQEPGAGGSPGKARVAPVRRKNKALIILGIASIGGGTALMVLGPTSTSQSPGTTTYNTKVAGGIFAAAGAVSLGFGLRGK